jgi:2-iminobutanoate/2-iminopropanoate deaminase
MKLCAIALAMFLLASTFSLAADTDRKHIVVSPSPQRNALPFSDGVLVGNTLYVAGHLGLDKTGKPPATAEEEATLALNGIKETVEAAGMTMDDVVWIQIACTDLALYDTFNKIYRTYFHDQYPARAFLGTNALLRGAKFEVMAIAVKKGM